MKDTDEEKKREERPSGSPRAAVLLRGQPRRKRPDLRAAREEEA